MTMAKATEPVSGDPARDTLEHAGLAGVDLLALISNFHTIGAWRQVLSTGRVYWTPGMYRIFDMPLTAGPNLLMTLDRYHADDREIAVGVYEQALRNRLPFIFTVRLKGDEDHRRVVTAVGDHRTNGDGEDELYGIMAMTPGAPRQARIGR